LKPTRAPLVRARVAGFEGAPMNIGAGEKNSLLQH